MSTTATYPPTAAVALAFLKAASNDIAIYVEDTAAPNLWLKLLKKHLPEAVRLRSVTVLGSRDNVVRACRCDQSIDGNRRLYIVDGDLDLLKGRAKPKLRHLYRLRSYCVENYLLDEQAIVSAVMTLDPKAGEERVRRQVDYTGWVRRNETVLTQLFVCYAVTHELRGEKETVGFSVHRLLQRQDVDFDLCATKVSRRVVSLYRSIREVCSRHETRIVFDRVMNNAGKFGAERFVSGKDYVFPLLYKAIRRSFRINVRLTVLSVLIAECMKEVSDPYLSRRLKGICCQR